MKKDLPVAPGIAAPGADLQHALFTAPRDFLQIPGSTWNERLTQARNAKGLSKRKLASLVGVTPPTVTDWESGEIKSIEAEHLLQLARVLEVSPEWLLFGKPTLADLGKFDTSGMTSAQRRLHSAFEGLTPAQQDDAITRMETIRQQNARQLAELLRISDRLQPSSSAQSDLFPNRA